MVEYLHYKYMLLTISFTIKMAPADTPHYELYDEEKDIIIYGIKIEALFPEGFGITSQGVDIVHQIIPDVVEKCQNSSYGKKAIVLYNAGVLEVVQMR